MLESKDNTHSLVNLFIHKHFPTSHFLPSIILSTEHIRLNRAKLTFSRCVVNCKIHYEVKHLAVFNSDGGSGKEGSLLKNGGSIHSYLHRSGKVIDGQQGG